MSKSQKIVKGLKKLCKLSIQRKIYLLVIYGQSFNSFSSFFLLNPEEAFSKFFFNLINGQKS